MTGTPADGPEPTPPPTLRVVSGNPAPEHVAVLTALFAALGSGSDTAPPAATSAWAASARASRRFPRPGADAWRLSVRR